MASTGRDPVETNHGQNPCEVAGAASMSQPSGYDPGCADGNTITRRSDTMPYAEPSRALITATL